MAIETSTRTWRIPTASRLMLFSLCVATATILLPLVSVAQQSEATIDAESGRVHIDLGDAKSYGVDASWPMQKHGVANQQYEKYMNGCYEQGYIEYEKRADNLYQRKDENDIRAEKRGTKDTIIACNDAEQDRLEMNLNQPKEMQNYTYAGYAKLDTPSKVTDLLKEFWKKNDRFEWPEFWNSGNTYVNHWEVPTSLLDIGRKDVPHPLATQEYETIIRSIQDVLESWTNQRLVLTSAYGIRIYKEGAILAPHVDRLPLVSSAIINVFQQGVTEPWVLEVIGHDGKAHNLTSNPGQMILYESASIIHGRPYPLKGKGAMYGSLFVHFEPLYHTLRHAERAGDHYAATDKKEASKNAFEEALRKQLQKPTLQELVGKSLPDSGKADENKKTTIPNSATRDPSKAAFRKTPGYVWPEYVSMYDQQFYFEYEDNVSPKTSKTVFENLNSHRAASLGKLSLLKEIAETQGRDQLFKIDHNGWRPIHEAARGGHADIIEYLVKEGAKPNERTNFNEGGSPLYWAKTDPIKNAKAIAMLEKYGGVDVPPLDKSKKGGKTDQKDLDTEKKTSDKDKDKDKDKQEM